MEVGAGVRRGQCWSGRCNAALLTNVNSVVWCVPAEALRCSVSGASPFPMQGCCIRGHAVWGRVRLVHLEGLCTGGARRTPAAAGTRAPARKQARAWPPLREEC